MKIAAIVVLSLSAFAFACGFPICFLLNMDGPRLVMELDRAGAIDTDVIKKDFPQFSVNLRHDLGVAFTSGHQKVLIGFLFIGFGACSFGAYALLKTDRGKDGKN